MHPDFDWLGMLGVLTIMTLLFGVPTFVLRRDRKRAEQGRDKA